MPRSRQPSSLEDQCTHFIARNEHLWSQADIGCFVAPVVEKLLDAVLRTAQKTNSLWQQFQNSGFFGARVNRIQYQQWNTGLDRLFLGPLSSQPQHELDDEDVENVFTKFLQSCKQLAHLELPGCFGPSYTEERVYSLLTGCDLSHLLVLNLRRIRLREDTLGIIGSCCPKLRELQLEGCRGVNNISIKLLIKKGSDGQCVLKHLKVLDVLWTNVGVSGVEHVLTSIPTITDINCGGGVFTAALKLLGRGSVAPPLHLEKLDAKYLASLFHSEENPTGSPLDMSAFANLKYITITVEYRKELELLKAFYSLQNLDKLCLQIYHFPGCLYGPPKSLDDESDGKMKVIPFEPHVSGLIQNIGGNLNELNLDIASQVSFLTIGQSCPNLRRLSVYFRNVKSEMRVSDLQGCFRQVEYVSLRQHRQGTRPEGTSATGYEEFFLGLLSPMHRLKHLSIKGIKMGNRFLFNLISRNPLTQLEYLAGDFGITDSDILLFLEDCPRLHRFMIKVDDELKQQCKVRGWDIEFGYRWWVVDGIWCNGIC